MNVAARILTNKWFWVVLGLVVLFFLLRGPITRAWAMLKRATLKDSGDYSEGSRQDAKALEALAQTAYNQLTAGVPSPMEREAALQALVDLNDTELRIAAKHYNMLSRDVTLYQAVDAAWMPLSDADEALMGRLANIGMI